MISFTVDQVRLQHHYLMVESGGMDEIRDMGLLESALKAPFQTYEGQYLYSSVEQKAARLCYSVIMNHPFVDGNKRIGVHLMLLFLEAHKYGIRYKQEELVELGFSLAMGKLSDHEVAEWISNHQV